MLTLPIKKKEVRTVLKRKLKKPDTDPNSPTDPLWNAETHRQIQTHTHSHTHTETIHFLTDMTKYPLDNLCFVIRDSPVTTTTNVIIRDVDIGEGTFGCSMLTSSNQNRTEFWLFLDHYHILNSKVRGEANVDDSKLLLRSLIVDIFLPIFSGTLEKQLFVGFP